MAQQSIDDKIEQVYKRIQTERKIIEATRTMSLATTNQAVLTATESKIREAERSLSYFEQTLRELQERKLQLQQSPTSPRDGQSSRAGSISSSTPDRSLPPLPSSAGAGGPSSEQPKQKLSNLDLIKADAPISTAKISRMLHQLEFKLQVEMQYKRGIDKMARLYQVDGDKKSRADAESKRIESEKKIQLLQSALKRYKTLHILDDAVDEEEAAGPDTEGDRKDNLRSKALSGRLKVTLRSARDLEHPPITNTANKSRSAAKSIIETYLSIKVEGTERARSMPTRSDRWNEEFEIPLEKANEVEFALYDKHVAQPYPVPIGLLWINIGDLVEAQRRQKVLMESGQGGWVTAGAIDGDHPAHNDMNASLAFNNTAPVGGAGGAGGQSDSGIETWFSVEPAGAVSMKVSFTKENVRRRQVDTPMGGLARREAVKKRKDEVHEMNGHKFVQRQFYQLMLCAFCSEFLLNTVGYQCEDCQYTCHKKCHEKVVTKCISKSNAPDDDEEKINHRIPHRFEPLTNIGANWCCHCGYMMSLGRKNARKCSECGVTCHAYCAHLVPDFCGMSMETANQILTDWRNINRARGGKKPATIGHGMTHSHQQSQHQQQQQAYQQPAPTSPRQSPEAAIGRLPSDMGALKLDTAPPSAAVGVPPDPFAAARPSSAQPDVRYVPQQPLPGSGSQTPRPPPGARPPAHPQYPYEQQLAQQQQQQQQQPPSRPSSAYDRVQQQQDVYSPQAGYSPKQQHAQPQQPLAQAQKRPGAATAPSSPQQSRQQSLPPTQSPPSQHQQIQQQQQYIQQQQQQQQQQYAQQQQPPRQQQQQQQQQQQVAHRQPTQAAHRRRVGLDDFNFLAVLGKGNFGKVMLAEEKRSNNLYAIKVLKKEFIIDNDEVESTRSEKRVFLAASRERHPFLIGLHSCFQTETRVYFVMEYVSGGDLMLHIQRKQFSLRQAKFYACEVLLALEYFHAQGIIYRDLKLDNILLTLDGHVKVADYGLCKEEMWYGQTTSTFCGTPEFMAPEILLEQRYGRAVDWWAFGVLMYEMLLGQSPFRGDDEDEIFDAILEDEPLYPITMPRDAVSILQKLLTRDPTRRLGSGKTDAQEVKSQPFFKDVNFDDVLNKRIPPPYFPTIKGSADTSNFDEEFTREQPTLTPVHGQLSSRDQAEFNGFSWVAAWADQ